MLQDIVIPKVIKGEACGVGLGVRGHAEVEEKPAQRLVDVEPVKERVSRYFAGDVFPVVWKKAVVGKGVEHGTRSPN